MNNSRDSKFYHIIFNSTDNPANIFRYVNENCFYINQDEKVIREEVNSAEYDLKVVPNINTHIEFNKNYLFSSII